MSEITEFEEGLKEIAEAAKLLNLQQRQALLSLVTVILLPEGKEKRTVDCCLCGDTPFEEEAGTFDIAGRCQEHAINLHGECCRSCYLKLVVKLREVTTP